MCVFCLVRGVAGPWTWCRRMRARAKTARAQDNWNSSRELLPQKWFHVSLVHHIYTGYVCMRPPLRLWLLFYLCVYIARWILLRRRRPPAMRVRELFRLVAYLKLIHSCFFLLPFFLNCDFILRMHLVIVQGPSSDLAGRGPKCSLPGAPENLRAISWPNNWSCMMSWLVKFVWYMSICTTTCCAVVIPLSA